MNDATLTRDADTLLTFVYDVAEGALDTEVDVTPFIEKTGWTEAHYLHVVDHIEKLGWGVRVETSLPLHDGTQRNAEIDEGEAWSDTPLRHARNFALTAEGAGRVDAQRKDG
jgi:hypothetical protein